MNPTEQGRRRSRRFPLRTEGLEDRRLLSKGVSGGVSALEVNPIALPARHPNTPVMPFATPTKKASFIDPTVQIINGNSVVISFQTYVAPYARLDASGHGAIKIGDGSEVLDSAQLIANPGQPVQDAAAPDRQQRDDLPGREDLGAERDRLVFGLVGDRLDRPERGDR